MRFLLYTVTFATIYHQGWSLSFEFLTGGDSGGSCSPSENSPAGGFGFQTNFQPSSGPESQPPGSNSYGFSFGGQYGGGQPPSPPGQNGDPNFQASFGGSGGFPGSDPNSPTGGFPGLSGQISGNFQPPNFPGLSGSINGQFPGLPGLSGSVNGQFPGLPGLSGSVNGQFPGLPGLSGSIDGQFPGLPGLSGSINGQFPGGQGPDGNLDVNGQVDRTQVSPKGGLFEDAFRTAGREFLVKSVHLRGAKALTRSTGDLVSNGFLTARNRLFKTSVNEFRNNNIFQRTNRVVKKFGQAFGQIPITGTFAKAVEVPITATLDVAGNLVKGLTEPFKIGTERLEDVENKRFGVRKAQI